MSVELLGIIATALVSFFGGWLVFRSSTTSTGQRYAEGAIADLRSENADIRKRLQAAEAEIRDLRKIQGDRKDVAERVLEIIEIHGGDVARLRAYAERVIAE